MITITKRYDLCTEGIADLNGLKQRFYVTVHGQLVGIDMDDTAKVAGFKSWNDLLGSDWALDLFNTWKVDNPNKPMVGDISSGAMFQTFYVPFAFYSGVLPKEVLLFKGYPEECSKIRELVNNL